MVEKRRGRGRGGGGEGERMRQDAEEQRGSPEQKEES